MIKAVFFDIDGVLLDSFEANREFFSKLFEKTGYKRPTLQQYSSLMHFPMKNLIKGFTKASDEEVQRIWEMGRESLEEIYPFELLKNPHFVNEILENLEKIYQLGIVTSRVKEHIYAIPQLATLEKYFQVTIGFEDTNNHKPDPEPLVFAAQKLQIKPKEVVYIGDAESDFHAAKTAGMEFILFGEKNFLRTDNHVTSFKNLPEIIANL